MTTKTIIPTIRRWDTYPDRESLRVIDRFLRNCEIIGDSKLKPHESHPQMVRATVSEQDSSTIVGILNIQWYETRHFVITYETGRENDTSSHFRWIHPPDADDIKFSHSNSDEIKTLTTTSHHLSRIRFHPLRVLSLVLATIKECPK